MPRIPLSPGGLYTLLNSELERRRVTGCSCQMPLAYMVERPDESSANWRIGNPSPCRHGCDVLIAEVVAEMWTRYDLLDVARHAPGVGQLTPQTEPRGKR